MLVFQLTARSIHGPRPILSMAGLLIGLGLFPAWD